MKHRKTVGASEPAEAEVEFSIIPHKTLLALYGELQKVRTRHGSAIPSHAWKYDAAAVAAAQDLVPGDTVIAESTVPAVRQARMKASGFAAVLERALGIALGHKTKNSSLVTVVFATRTDGSAWADALEVARAHRLPIVFVAELRESKAVEEREQEPGTELARIIVDGNDVVGSYRVAHEAIERARRDRGPTLIECTAFRLKGRRQQDPVAMMNAYLRAKGLLKV